MKPHNKFRLEKALLVIPWFLLYCLIVIGLSAVMGIFAEILGFIVFILVLNKLYPTTFSEWSDKYHQLKSGANEVIVQKISETNLYVCNVVENGVVYQFGAENKENLNKMLAENFKNRKAI